MAPQHLLRTDCLELRPAADADLEPLHALWTDPDVRRFLFDDREISLQEARGFLERSDESFRECGYGIWLFCESSREPAIGGFAGLLRSSELEPSLIFGTRPDLWGRGYATAAASAVLRYGFGVLGLARIVADVDEPNRASIRVLERLGMLPVRRTVVNDRPLLYYEIRR